MKTTRKPTRKMIARQVVYELLRKYVKAELAASAAMYDTNEYATARWQVGHYWGAANGAIDMAKALDVFGFSEAGRMKSRASRIDSACHKRCVAIREEKYARLHNERTAP